MNGGRSMSTHSGLRPVLPGVKSGGGGVRHSNPRRAGSVRQRPEGHNGGFTYG